MPGRVTMLVAGLCGLGQAASVATPGTPTAPAPRVVVLPRDTPVVLLATSEVRSDHAAAGMLFRLRVQQPVLVGSVEVVPVGTPAVAQVVSAKGSGVLGRNGTMEVTLRHIQLGDARIALTGERAATGTGAGSVRTAMQYLGVLGVLHRGNNAKIKAGELLSGFVAEDVTLDLNATPVRRVDAAVGATAP